LVGSVALVGVFEFLSLLGEDYKLRRDIAFPFFLVICFLVGWRTLLEGARSLVKLNFKSINLLMTIAVVGAFYLGEYEEAAVVIVLFSLAERLEHFGIESSKSALQSLVARTPKKALIRRGSEEVEIPVVDVAVDDILILRPAEMVALDGEVVLGSSSVDESTITGEPLPKDKQLGDKVFAGTLNMQGYLEAKVLKGAKDTTLAKIIEVTFAATKTKAETQKFIETFASYYTPAIIIIAALLIIVPTLLLSQPFDPWLERAITILVIACPCALVVSTPISIYAAVGNASANGVLVKGGRFIEAIGQVKAIAMDKTRTLTYGKPKVTDVIPFGDTTREHLLACAAGIESYSEHPLAQAVVSAAKNESIETHSVENFRAVLGKGAQADCLVCYDKHHCIGKLGFIEEEHEVQKEVAEKVDELQREGKTSIVLGSNSGIDGIIALTDEIKADSKLAVSELRDLGIESIMLTGDNHAPARLVAEKVGITEVKAEMLPEDKAEAIKELLDKYGTVAMVGDGVNDAPALALSTVGIAMGAAGSDTAIEAASVAILNDRLELVPYLVRLGRRAINTIWVNTVLAVLTKLVFVVLAILGFSNYVGGLAGAIFADVGVTILVIVNSLRILRFR
ncbi:MAG: cation-translocating P-type ATPase, partial [Acidobacteria bacterium]|nr:cation-translocating P-type ATPase [Acidobacteriota bacterium]